MILQLQLVEPRVRVWHAINQARKVKGLRSLALSSTLCRIAEDHATDMNYRGYTRATAPDGLTPQQRLQYAPYQWTQGLLMILRSSSDHANHAVSTWLKSKAAQTLLAPDVSEIGIAHIARRYGRATWVVYVMGGRSVRHLFPTD